MSDKPFQIVRNRKEIKIQFERNFLNRARNLVKRKRETLCEKERGLWSQKINGETLRAKDSSFLPVRRVLDLLCSREERIDLPSVEIPRHASLLDDIKSYKFYEQNERCKSSGKKKISA